MPGNNSLTIVLTQRENGEVLSTTTLEYPSLENATANVLSFDLLDAVQACVERWAESKAGLLGEYQVFELAQSLCGKSGKAPKE